MNRINLLVAAVFGALGIYLAITAWQMPAGMGRLPGPGFFPGIIGAAMLLLCLLLLAGQVRGVAAGPPAAFANAKSLAVTAALLAAYLLLWGQVPFAVRTVVFVILFLRLLGQRWRSALAVALVLTAGVVLAFQYGLRVNLQ
jgi:hypothetical protein